MLCEQRYPRELIVERLEVLALAEVKALKVVDSLKTCECIPVEWTSHRSAVRSAEPPPARPPAWTAEAHLHAKLPQPLFEGLVGLGDEQGAPR